MNFMKLLILGSKGMLGQALYRGIYAELGGTNAEVVGWDRSAIDITDKNQVTDKISALAPNVIINTAAYNNVDKAEGEDRELAMKINGEAVGYLVEAVANLGAILVHYSTDYVFKGDNPNGYREDDIPEPQSVYGQSKFLGEQKLINLLTYKLLNFYLIRTSRLFGPAGVGEGAKKSFVETMLKLGKEKGELDVIDEETSSPTFVKDLARATIELIKSKAPYGIYHRTNSGACTWYGWAKKIFELAGLNIKLNPVPASRFPRSAVRPKYSMLLTTKLPPLRRWEEALEEYLESIKY